MIYTERVDLGRCRECHICIVASDGYVSARMTFYNNGKNTYDIFMCKDTADDVVKVSHRLYKRKSFPEYVKRVLNVLSRLVLPSIYYKECVFNETR